ncbi:MAG: hypothetical protein ACYC5K_14390 [Saccharofermentanales bacterium]
MQDRSSQEKYITLHTKSGSVGMALIAAFATVMVLVPSIVFMLKIYASKLSGDGAREILQIASVNACQGISREQLGKGLLFLDQEKAGQYFQECVEMLLDEKPYIEIIGHPEAEFSTCGNMISVYSSIRILTAFGNEAELDNTAEFMTETLPEERK